MNLTLGDKKGTGWLLIFRENTSTVDTVETLFKEILFETKLKECVGSHNYSTLLTIISQFIVQIIIQTSRYKTHKFAVSCTLTLIHSVYMTMKINQIRLEISPQAR